VQIPPALALRGIDILWSRRLLREADSETQRGLLASIRLAAVSFCGQVKVRRRDSSPPQEVGLGLVVGVSVPVASASASRSTRSVAAVSRALTQKIVEAPWPPVSEAAPPTIASPSPMSRGSPGLFLLSPITLYEGDIVMTGAVALSFPLGPRSPSLFIILAGFLSSPPSVLSSPAAPAAPSVPAAPASPVAVAATTRIIALLECVVAQGDEQILVLCRVEAAAAEMLTRLCVLVSFSIVFLLLMYG
jgi:hypothetical protein